MDLIVLSFLQHLFFVFLSSYYDGQLVLGPGGPVPNVCMLLAKLALQGGLLKIKKL